VKKVIHGILILAILFTVSGCTYFLPDGWVSGMAKTSADTGGTVTITKHEYEALKRFRDLSEILDIVNEQFYVDFEPQDALTGAARGLLYALEDPYTFYYSPAEYTKMWEDDKGEYAGIGIQILPSSETLLCSVSRVFKDTPAERAGILKGDILVKVEDVGVDAYSLQEAVDIMRGKVGETVTIRVQRGDDMLDFIMERALIKVNRVEYMMLGEDTGYIVLYEFAGDCQKAVSDALDDLISNGAQSLILDLRDNPGGWISDAEAIANLFLDRGVIYYLQYRDGEKDYSYTRNGSVEIKLAMLINENSASATEVLAGALQDRGRAVIVGTQSFGKGVVQHVMPVGNDGAGIQYTAAQYFTPDGNQVHGVGITPDVEIIMSQEDKTRIFELGDMQDAQLKKAYDIINE
jgi:carboxyl-terminal processing protease